MTASSKLNILVLLIIGILISCQDQSTESVEYINTKTEINQENSTFIKTTDTMSQIIKCEADKLLEELNSFVAMGCDPDHPVLKNNTKCSEQEKQNFIQLTNRLKEMQIDVQWNNEFYVLEEVNADEMITELNQYVAAGADVEHPKGLKRSTGETSWYCQLLKEKLKNRCIPYAWNEETGVYELIK